MTMNKKMKKLLLDAAIKFHNSSSPFYREWLADREVTSDECIELSTLIGLAIENFVDDHVFED